MLRVCRLLCIAKYKGSAFKIKISVDYFRSGYLIQFRTQIRIFMLLELMYIYILHSFLL